MDKVEYQVGSEDVLQLRHAHSDVAVKGWDEDVVQITADGDLEACTVERQGNLIVVDSQVPLSLNVPYKMTVRIDQIEGDLVLGSLDGEASVGQVSGSCDLRSGAATVSLGTVSGDLEVEGTSGPLSVGEAHADVRLTDVGGPVELKQVHGDLRASDLDGELVARAVQRDVRVQGAAGSVAVEQAQGDFKGSDLRGGMSVQTQGDLSLKTVLVPGMVYVGQAQGDISVRVPADASAHFFLEAQGGISTRLMRVEEKESGQVEGQMGAGEAQVTLKAGGHLSLKPDDDWETGGFSWRNLGETISEQVRASMAGLEVGDLVNDKIQEAMRRAEHEMARAQRHAEEHARRAGEHAHRAQRHAEEQARQAEEHTRRHAEEQARRVQDRVKRAAERAERKARKFSVMFSPTWEGRQARRGPSEEEQMRILEMLQEGKITVEEAEMLLRALEG